MNRLTASWLLLPLVVAALLGCPRRPQVKLGMSDSTFVATMADLRRIEADSTGDRAMQDSSRRVVLRRHGVTADALERAARALAADPPRAAALFRSIDERGQPAPRLPAPAPKVPGRAP
jgi:hypothetical protein